MKITLKRFLQDYRMKDLVLTAGGKGLSSPILKVTVLDAPDGPSWLKGGEFILSSTYLFNNDPERLYRFCEQLINFKAAALGLKMGRYLTKVPQALIDLCDRNNFPLIIIPYSFVWTDIISVFYELNYNLEREEKYSTLKSKLVAQIRQNRSKGIEWIAKMIYTFFDTPLLFLDAELNPILSVGTDEEKEELMEEVKIYFQKDSISYQNDRFSRDKYFSFNPCCFEQSNAKNIVFSSSSSNIIGELKEILTDANIIVNEKKIEFESENDLICRALQILLLEDRIQHNLLDSLNKSMAQSDGYYCMLYVQNSNTQQVLSVLNDKIKSTARNEVKSFMVFNPIKMESLIVLRFYGKQNYYDIVMLLRKIIFELDTILSEENYKEQVFISNIFDSYSRIEQCYREVRVTAQYSRILWENRKITYFEEIFPYYLIINSDVSPMYLDGIEKLQSNEANVAFDCMTTLEAFLRNGNIKQTAKELFIHENTLRYRIKKIGKIICADFEDATTCQNYVIRVNLWKLKKGLREKNSGVDWERMR